jgi:hypothetical protein
VARGPATRNSTEITFKTWSDLRLPGLLFVTLCWVVGFVVVGGLGGRRGRPFRRLVSSGVSSVCARRHDAANEWRKQGENGTRRVRRARGKQQATSSKQSNESREQKGRIVFEKRTQTRPHARAAF